MNAEMRLKLGLDENGAKGCQLEDLLTVGSKIFYQTHFYPLIKMQKSAREIYLVFKGIHGPIPVLLNVEVKHTEKEVETICGGMEISNRNRYEKELLEAKRIAEAALTENAELKKIKSELVDHQKTLEIQYRELKSLKQQQQEVFKLIAHDLQEPLRKSIFSSNYILSKHSEVPDNVNERLLKIINYNNQMRDMLLTLLRFKELEDVQLKYSKIELPELIKTALIESDLENNEHLSITYPEKGYEFYADHRIITRLFVELLKNSQNDRNPDNKKLIISISAIEITKNSFVELTDKYQYDKFIKITYQDNGLGFRTKTSEFLQKSIEFNTINIGLAYSKQIVERHSGTIEARSIQGKGVSYTILLPLQKPIELA
jgi:sigma-B regulation protein RsbU (phosphoserine phosphatase)